MLRPERMSRVSVTAAKRVQSEVIETIHDLGLLHVTEYDDSWDGFEPGDPVDGADRKAERLVTVRALESILDVDEDDVGRTDRLLTEEDLDERLEEIRTEVNELDERRDDITDRLRSVEEELEMLEPFVHLGIDLDLLRGYDSLAVQVGHGDDEEIRQALTENDVSSFEIFANERIVGIFAQTDLDSLQEALVDAPFTALEIPEGEGDPQHYRDELRHERERHESELETVENELEDLKLEVADFLLAAEETLAIDLQKREAPLSFATTENAFIAEGWIPTDRYEDLVDALETSVGDHVEIQELERASYDRDGHPHDHEPVQHEEGAVTDGGTVTTGTDEPPVVQQNPSPAKPFELLTNVIGRPLYWEFDPTLILLLTFPLMFGFMIGDLGYGILYVLIGAGIIRSFDSPGWTALGGIAVWAGAFTILFGILYGEIFGLHVLGDVVWGGHPPIHKGLQPAYIEYAELWLVISIIAGLAHVSFGYVLGFIKEAAHSVRHAVMEYGAWLLMVVGFWSFIFSAVGGDMKPSFLVGADAALNGNPIPLGFAGFGETIGMIGIAVFALGLIMIAIADFVEAIEAIFLKVLVDGLSYTRIAAVLLAKAGMAFTINLLFFGVYATGHGGDVEWHFALNTMPSVGSMYHGHEVTSQLFPGLMHMGIAGLLAGLVVLVVGHALVLALGVTSAGLQAVRLEYVEFFQKFYEGGGDEYDPFGYTRRFTAEE